MFSCVFSTRYATGWESEVDTLFPRIIKKFDQVNSVTKTKAARPGKHRRDVTIFAVHGEVGRNAQESLYIEARRRGFC